MSAELIKNLQNAALYAHPVSAFNVIETHCSWVLLTGKFAYKIKKNVNFGFLDYSALEKRLYYCQEEIKRNQLLASEIYLKLVPIYGTSQNPSFQADSEPIEYAVQMAEFSQTQILSQLLATQKLAPVIIEQLAVVLAQFHQHAELVPPLSDLGSAAHAQQQTINNFTQIMPLLEHSADRIQLNVLAQQVEKYYEKIKSLLESRKENGFVRQCHGDVHLNNIVYLNNKTVIFDCIDFNNDFCWTDTMGDLGFITMDLDAQEQFQLSNLLLNRYLQISGDYSALQVLPYFQAYRAMVRAKIGIFSNQYANYKKYVTLATSYLNPQKPQLVLMCGLSASGKSTIANELAPPCNAIVLTADRERKRIANIALEQDCSAPVLAGLYHPEHTTKTYTHLLRLAHLILDAGYTVIVDASFREQCYRQQFIDFANTKKIKPKIIHCTTDLEILKARLIQRQQHAVKVSEASLDVLQMQHANFDAFTPAEKKHVITVDTLLPLEFSSDLVIARSR